MSTDDDAVRRVGLCATCRHARRRATRRGSEFWQCLRADRDPGFQRYPALPVQECVGFEPGPSLPDEG